MYPIRISIFLCSEVKHQVSQTFDTMTTIFEAIVILRGVFDKYAGKEGDPKTLTKKEVLELIKEQLGETPPSQAAIDEFFSALDEDGDGVVDFNEYVILCATLAMMLAP